jgi:Ca2+-transporting ATPase
LSSPVCDDAALRGDAPPTPLQLKLNALAELIAILGSVAGAILFGSLMIRFFVQLGPGVPARSASQKGAAFVDILIIAVTVVRLSLSSLSPLSLSTVV